MRQRSTRPDGEATRTKIMESAGELFAINGFADTTSKAIAARAGVDLASINYHFGSRVGLYQATLIEAHRRLMSVSDLTRLATAPVPPSDKLRQLIAYFVDLARGPDPGWHLSLLAGEIFSPSSHIHAMFQTESQPKITLLKTILAEITDIPAGDPAITCCMVSIGAPCVMMLLSRDKLPGPMHDIHQMSAAELTEHLHQFALAGLSSVGQRYAAKSRQQNT